MAKEKTGGKNKKGIKYQIQSKISSSVAVIMALVIVLVVVVVYNLLISANNTELKLDAEAVALQVEKFFSPFERMVEQQALNGEIVELIETTGEGEKLTENPLYSTVVDDMAEVQKLDSEDILTVWVAGIECSAVIASDGAASGEGFDVTSRAYYSCTETKETMLTEVYVDTGTGERVLSVATPVCNKSGQAIGIMGMDIAITNIIDMMKNYTIGENGYAMLMTSGGTFLYHPNEELIDTLIQDMGISDSVGEAIEAQDSKTIRYRVSGETKYGYIMPISDTGFMVLSCIPSGQYFSTLFITLIMLLVILLAGLVFIIFVIGKTTGKIVKPLLDLNDNAMELAKGNLNVTIKVDTDDEVGDLGRSIDKTVTRLKEYIDYIDEISEVLADMANGKLAIQLKYAYVGEFEKVKDALNNISGAMTDVMTNIAESSRQVSTGSDDLARAAQNMAESCGNQAAAIEELLATATTVAEQVEENKSDSEQSAAYTKEVEAVMETSKNQMDEMRKAMDNIQVSSNEVVGVIKTIEDIAEQTNLLALNASIEAARAGEAGKGFAVVAGEIGGLANQSAEAVNTTRDLIGVSLREIEKGNAIVNDVVESLNKAVEKVITASEMIQKGAKTAEVQMDSVNQIRDGVDEMSQSIQDNSAMAEETSATSEELAAQAVVLNELVEKFELN